eukprot:g47601.t1
MSRSRVQDILKQERKQTELIVHIGTNDMGYRCFKWDRKGNKRGGRVALLIRDRITALFREDTLENSCSEALWVEFRNRKGEITMLGVFNRCPTSPHETDEQ